MKRFLGAVAAGALALATALAVPVVAQAADPDYGPIMATVIEAPDDTYDGQPWARDTFVIETVISNVDGDYVTYSTITGTWHRTNDVNIKGTLTGYISYTVDGTLKQNVEAIDASLDLTSLVEKDKAAPLKVIEQYFEGVVTPKIGAWSYTYSNCQGKVVEGEVAEVAAEVMATVAIKLPSNPDFFNKICTDPPAEPTIVDPVVSCIDGQWLYKAGSLTFPAVLGVEYDIQDGNINGWQDSLEIVTPDDDIVVRAHAKPGYALPADTPAESGYVETYEWLAKEWRWIFNAAVPVPTGTGECPPPTTPPAEEPTEEPDPTGTATATGSSSPTPAGSTPVVTGSTTGRLPVTGDSFPVFTVVAVSVGLLIAGAGLLIGLRRRREHESSSVEWDDYRD